MKYTKDQEAFMDWVERDRALITTMENIGKYETVQLERLQNIATIELELRKELNRASK